MHLQAAKVGIFYPLETYREQWEKGENGFSLIRSGGVRARRRYVQIR